MSFQFNAYKLAEVQKKRQAVSTLKIYDFNHIV